MSSIPLQFLVYTIAAPSCGLPPVILPPDICVNVQLHTPVTFNISAMTLCDPNISGISTITVSNSIDGMHMSSTTDSLTNASLSYVTFHWIPETKQLGLQLLCVIAYSK